MGKTGTATTRSAEQTRSLLALALVSLAALTGCTESPPPVADAGPSQTDAGAHDGAVDAGPGEDAPTFDPRELLDGLLHVVVRLLAGLLDLLERRARVAVARVLRRLECGREQRATRRTGAGLGRGAGHDHRG